MTQRFGGLFSILNQRDYTDLIRIAEEEKDPFEDPPDFSTMSRRQIIEAIEEIEGEAEFHFEFAQNAPDMFPEPSSEGLAFMSQNRLNRVKLASIKKKLKVRK